MQLFLIDGNTTNPTVGGDRGYGAKNTFSGTFPGVTNGYVGIILDAWNGCLTFPAPCNTPDRVAVLGAGSTYSGFAYLESVELLPAFPAVGKIAPVERNDARTVRITVSPVTPAAPYPKVTVEIDPNDGVTDFVKVIDAFSLAGNGPVPATFKMGFGASTGGTASIQEVRIKSAKTLISAVPTLEQNALGALAVVLALLTVPALRRRFKN